MDVAHVVLLVLHIGGVVALLAGLLVQVRRPEKKVNGLMRDGVGTAFVAGLFLVGVLEAGDDPVDHTKIAVKFAIGLVLLVLVMANLRKEWIPAGLYWALLVLTLANVGVALVGLRPRPQRSRGEQPVELGEVLLPAGLEAGEVRRGVRAGGQHGRVDGDAGGLVGELVERAGDHQLEQRRSRPRRGGARRRRSGAGASTASYSPSIGYAVPSGARITRYSEPPGRGSSPQSGIVKWSGANHAANCSASVQARHTSAIGAGLVCSIRNGWPGAAIGRPSLRLRSYSARTDERVSHSTENPPTQSASSRSRSGRSPW